MVTQNGFREVPQVGFQTWHDAVEDDGSLKRTSFEAELDSVLSEVRCVLPCARRNSVAAHNALRESVA